MKGKAGTTRALSLYVLPLQRYSASDTWPKEYQKGVARAVIFASTHQSSRKIPLGDIQEEDFFGPNNEYHAMNTESVETYPDATCGMFRRWSATCIAGRSYATA
ncbi:hypothetical protein BDM02DRAFT_3108933 [Thelephora ganbajun]|uniref:Uncharacterized protein n=1 Tax=Thelephora ganbajun TaxID=370292 RepID=A0ACB6ZT62_THEGA|nr:hypothetical protein BDM02DRAFT_3108933 [Thelephora ganbajun]